MPNVSLIDEPIPRISLADSVYEKLLEAIASGKLQGGAEVNEVALAKALGVSRTPVHEAVVRLLADGFIDQQADRKLRIVRLAKDELASIYAMRRLLEGEAAYRAATRISSEVLADLRRQADELWNSLSHTDWCEREIEYDLEFHEAIARASDNPHLFKDIVRYRRLVKGFCRLSGTRPNLEAALSEHVRILDALDRRDAEAAGREMREHVDARLSGIEAFLK